MRRKSLSDAKLIVTVEGNKTTGKIRTVSVFDNHTKEPWSQDRIHERGIEWFLDLAHMKETLNWNLNGDSSKFHFQWGQSTKEISEGRAYVFH